MWFFRYDGPLARLLSKVFDLLVLNVLWIIGCIPVVTIGASTAAMYAVLMKLVKNEGYAVILPFVKSFKENLKQATAIWLMLLIAALTVGASLFSCFFGVLGGMIAKLIVLIASCLLGIPVIFVTLYVFPLQACFNNSVKQTVQNALIIALTYLPRTVLMILLDIAILGISVLLVPGLSLFAVVLTALANAWLIKPVFAKYTPEEEAV